MQSWWRSHLELKLFSPYLLLVNQMTDSKPIDWHSVIGMTLSKVDNVGQT